MAAGSLIMGVLVKFVTDVETIVVGAGVVGLAVAHQLSNIGQEVLVLERHGLIGSEISARNSEVIHAGIYYPQNSLKAQMCVAGKKLIYDHCAEYGVNHAHCGKLIVATDEKQVGILETIRDSARLNAVDDLRWLDARQVREIEPHISCVAALLSPSTGIIDSHGFMLSLQGVLEDNGGSIALGASCTCAHQQIDGSFALVVEGEKFSGYEITCRNLVIAAGLGSSDIASGMFGQNDYAVPRTYYAKGNYYALQGKAPFSRLIYPVPEPGGLGIHLSLDLAGQVRFGPDVEWVDDLDYDVDPKRSEKFYAAIRRYWPDLKEGTLSPDYAGIRPKLSRQGEPAVDFMIHGPVAHGCVGLVFLYGIESPGLTSSLAIAHYVAELLGVGVPGSQ